MKKPQRVLAADNYDTTNLKTHRTRQPKRSKRNKRNTRNKRNKRNKRNTKRNKRHDEKKTNDTKRGGKLRKTENTNTVPPRGGGA